MSESVDTGAAAASEGQDVSANSAEGVNQNAQAKSGQDAGSGAVSAQSKAQTVKDVINELGDADMDKLVTLKVNGKEEKMPLREALKISRMEKASQAKMQEAAQIQKQFQAVMNLAKSNPREFLQRTGIDPYEFAESTLAEKYEMMQMTPEQKKAMELERKVKEYEEREKREKMTVEQRQKAEATAKIQGDLEKEIIEAWQESGLPKHRYFAARISAEMLSGLAQKKAGYREDTLSAKEAATKVKAEVTAELKDILLSVAKTDPAAAQKLLGDDLLKILRDYDVKRVTGQSASNASRDPNRPAGQAASGKSQTNKPMSEREWNQYFKKL